MKPLHHGGRLQEAALRYGIPRQAWLDFSTAINPHAWPVPPLPADIWQRLPEDDDALEEAARQYYGQQPLLPVPGSQAVIETLPRLLPPCRVWVPRVGYQEHAYCWQKHGHRLQRYEQLPEAHLLASRDVVVVINPNNPTAHRHEVAALQRLAAALAERQGWLVVDEAFMDCTPEHSLLRHTLPPAVVVLRSFGKFFGLAGLRLGFCFASPDWLDVVRDALGPWAVNHPARWIGVQALLDTPWQHQTRDHLKTARQQLERALHDIVGTHARLRATDLFVTLETDAATALHEHLASGGLLTRLFAEEHLLRIGVGADAAQVARLLTEMKRFWR